MDMERRAVEGLFALIDGGRCPPEAFTRTVLERILYLEPACARAQALLAELDGVARPEDRVLSSIEEAEELAAHGVWYGARAVVEEIRRNFANHPIAREWLTGAHLLWEA